MAHCRHTLGQRTQCHLIDTVINIICIGILSHPDFKDYVRRSKSPDHGLITSAWHSILCSFPEGTKDELLYFWVYSPYLATHTSWADWIKQEPQSLNFQLHWRKQRLCPNPITPHFLLLAYPRLFLLIGVLHAKN